ncbi:hypothetical protein SERLA73DRAFT_191909 [Serpula lacrymans var. lacrymans S7.3]|uniref:BTB domain-containing protein n=2 Tax=Serpula lacrymans var. lacrymans TaxID=341189 RepID=F8QIK6_SERL3|nr:hypothetical protein SERLA73DRAFT_191909 [Serpula lacrymans var. lacrymans S7.3]
MSPSEALAESLRSGVFIDTKFYVYSQRGRKGGAKMPVSIFANSSILRASSVLLRYELEHTRAFHSCIAELDDDSVMRSKDDAEYSYENDSDLDDTENHADLSDLDDKSSSSVKTFGSDELTLIPPARPVPTFRISGRTLLVKDYAFKTWQALIFYLYTGAIAFSNLKSEETTNMADTCTPFPCSPKSMYRLADKFGLEDLKELAFRSICTKVTKCNIVDEVFSKFTSQYPAVQAKELELLVQHMNSPEVISALPRKFHSIARGDLPHCADVLTNVFLELADGGAPQV